MAVYLVSYDLDKPGKDYTGIINAIKNMGGVKGLFSEWFVVSRILSASQIYNALAPFIDSNDRLLVVALTGEAAWYNLMVSNEAIRKLFAA